MTTQSQPHPLYTLREQAEMAMQGKTTELQNLSSEEIESLVYELQVHQVELEIQNDELRLAHLQLEASHNLYADLYDFAPVGYLSVSETGVIQEANLTLALWLGVERSKLIGRDFSDFIVPADQDTAYLNYAALLEGGAAQQNEIGLIKQDESILFVRLDSSLRPLDASRPKAIRTTLVDVTARRHAEQALTQSYRELESRVQHRTSELAQANQALRESEDRLRFAMDVADICYWVWDTQTNRLHWGGPHEALFQLESDQAIGTYEALLARIYPSDRKSFEGTMDTVLGGSTSPQLEFRILWDGGKTRWVSIQAQAYQSASSGPFCVLGVMHDVTERKLDEQARAELLRSAQIARDLAEQATQSRMQFLGMVSHELRTPLTSIKGFAETLLAEDIHFNAEQQREMLTIIDQEADMLAELVEHLLDVSRIEAGALKINRVAVSLEEIIALGKSQFDALTGHHELILPARLDLPLVTADPVRIAQVITNLISNAVKHSPPNSGITLSANQIAQFIRVSVSDEGSGIPPEKREMVFQAFEQLERQSHLPSGVGLGLAICKSLVEAHGGQIWIEDRPEPGTTISFTLPVVSM